MSDFWEGKYAFRLFVRDLFDRAGERTGLKASRFYDVMRQIGGEPDFSFIAAKAGTDENILGFSIYTPAIGAYWFSIQPSGRVWAAAAGPKDVKAFTEDELEGVWSEVCHPDEDDEVSQQLRAQWRLHSGAFERLGPLLDRVESEVLSFYARLSQFAIREYVLHMPANVVDLSTEVAARSRFDALFMTPQATARRARLERFAVQSVGASWLDAPTFLAFVQEVVRPELETSFLVPVRAARAAMDWEAAAFAAAHRQGFLAIVGLDNSVDLYNKIVDMPRGDARTRRLSALSVLASGQKAHLGLRDFWNGVDAGLSVFRAVGDELGVAPATVRALVHPETGLVDALSWASRDPCGRQSYWTHHANRQFLGAWDRLSTQQRPNGAREMAFFFQSVALESRCAAQFGRDDRAHFQTVVHGLDLKRVGQEKGPWEALYFDRLRQLSVTCLSNEAAFSSDAFGTARREVGAANDMLQDVQNRLLLPLLLLRDYSPDPDDPVLAGLRQRWLEAGSIGWFMAASRYWHDPAVDFANRFLGVAMWNDAGEGWVPLLPTPLTLAVDGRCVRCVSLTTDAALKSEADAMGHCVWSYGARCKVGKSHIVSLCDGTTGARFSTLELVEKVKEGRRLVAIQQNRGVRNAQPVEAALRAAALLVEAINSGAQPVPWAAIDAARVTFRAHENENRVGWDFHDPDAQERLLHLYARLVPRPLAAAARGGFGSLAEALGVEDLLLPVRRDDVPRQLAQGANPRP
jgi:hypothetical protein